MCSATLKQWARSHLSSSSKSEQQATKTCFAGWASFGGGLGCRVACRGLWEHGPSSCLSGTHAHGFVVSRRVWREGCPPVTARSKATAEETEKEQETGALPAAPEPSARHDGDRLTWCRVQSRNLRFRPAGAVPSASARRHSEGAVDAG